MPRRKSGLPRPKPSLERREDALRPMAGLGRGRIAFGLYLMDRGAYDLAERQFRRAIWLNPYEPTFTVHLAASIYEQGRRDEAVSLLQEVLGRMPEHRLARAMLALWNAGRTRCKTGLPIS